MLAPQPLSKLPLALCSSLQPDLFILRLKRSHFLLASTSSHCSKVFEFECVCVGVCASVQEHLSQWEKEAFSTKGEGTAAMSAPLIRTGHMRGWKETEGGGGRGGERGRTFERKRQREIFDVILLNSLFLALAHSLAHTHSQTHTHERATRWLMSRCDADIWKGKVRRGDGSREQ